MQTSVRRNEFRTTANQGIGRVLPFNASSIADEVSKEALQLSEEFYKKVQLDRADWIKLGTTKTAMVYWLGERGQLKNNE